MPRPKLSLPKPKPASFTAPQPSAQMPWTGQRGTLEDLGSFGLSPEEFFGGGGRIMFSDTAPKPALTPKQGSMTTQQQAYINGFVKRAAEYGYSQQQAETILKQADMQGVLDSMKKGFGNLKNRIMGGYPEPIGPVQPPDSVGYEQAIGPVRPPASEGYDYPIGPTQPDNFMGAMSGGGSHVPSNKSINLGTNLTGNQPSMSPPAALMKGISDNSSVQAGLQGVKDNWQATRPHSFISGKGNPVMNLLPAFVRLPVRGALAMAAGGYGAGEDILNKAVNRNPRIAAGLQGYADKAQSALDRYGAPEWTTGATGAIGGGARVGSNLLKGLASVPAGAKGAYNAVQNYNQATPRQ